MDALKDLWVCSVLSRGVYVYMFLHILMWLAVTKLAKHKKVMNQWFEFLILVMPLLALPMVLLKKPGSENERMNGFNTAVFLLFVLIVFSMIVLLKMCRIKIFS